MQPQIVRLIIYKLSKYKTLSRLHSYLVMACDITCMESQSTKLKEYFKKVKITAGFVRDNIEQKNENSMSFYGF